MGSRNSALAVPAALSAAPPAALAAGRSMALPKEACEIRSNFFPSIYRRSRMMIARRGRSGCLVPRPVRLVTALVIIARWNYTADCGSTPIALECSLWLPPADQESLLDLDRRLDHDQDPG